MINVLMKDYWSRSDAFLLPLTGLPRTDRFDVKSYLFWNQYSIHDYKIIVTYDYTNPLLMTEYLRTEIFPILDKEGYLVENYDILDRSIFVLDLSTWGKDIDMFIQGRYSKFSKEAKERIEDFHVFNGYNIPIHVYAVLYPNMEMSLLDKKSPIDYVAENYNLNIEDMRKIGEIGSVFKEMEETLITNIEQLYDTE